AVDPATDVQRLIALLFELYADEWLLLPAMHYRWNVPENRAFAIEEFGRLSAPQLSQEEQRALGEKLAGPFAGALPALGVHPGTVPAIEASYRALLAELAEHFREHPFLLGTRPSIGDFALFGPLYAHLYRDPASGRMMNALAPEVARWIERMRTPKPDAGDFLDRDQVPETLTPPLARMFREFAPVLAKTIAKLAEFVPDPSRASLPRAIGTHCFELDSAQGERAIYPFNVWRFQRAHDHYQRLTGAARARADELLERALGLSLLRTPLTRRLVRVNNQLAFSS
ncbi:MAG TPA: glutathione S-transferase C-terminal domain-containing protein, partial [Polyangiaceae bacterium]|nr:glutathione S-transferase C-terminal domain-containing protein [Polyangiaceae bacterium]